MRLFPLNLLTSNLNEKINLKKIANLKIPWKFRKNQIKIKVFAILNH